MKSGIPTKARGFTLIELLISIAVFMVLMGLGVPSFLSAMKNSQLNADYSQLVGALYLARSEAVKRSSNVTVCARKTDTSCGTDWNKGWLVFTDNSNAGAGTIGDVDAGDEVLKVMEELDGREVVANATLTSDPSSSSNALPKSFVRYNPRGGNNWSGGTFVVCDDREEPHALALHVVLTGDIRKGRSEDSEVAQDVYGMPVVCPKTLGP